MTHTSNNMHKRQQGFTLIELSIVLVIIGLIVGGVLVGQDLIQAAEVRAQVSQFEKINTAVNTFRTKYNVIPGDLNIDDTFTVFTARSNDASRGDGDGLVESTAADTVGACGETSLFWGDVGTVAGLVEGNFVDAEDGATATCHAAAVQVNESLPPGKMGGSVAIFSAGGINFYQVGAISAITQTTGNITTAALLKNIEAYNIDTKMDDGIPVSGFVRAMDGTALNSAAAADGTCIEDSTTPDIYDIQTSAAQAETECQIRVQAQF